MSYRVSIGFIALGATGPQHSCFIKGNFTINLIKHVYIIFSNLKSQIPFISIDKYSSSTLTRLIHKLPSLEFS